MNDQTHYNLEICLPAGRYPVHLGPGLLGDAETWAGTLPPGKILIVSDSNVAPLYLDTVKQALGDRPAEILVLPAGETHKTVASWNQVMDKLVEIGALRDATLVALGGGVIGDLAGFAAATYMRGIRFVQAPTTLLAQVDASVGGKTAVNHPAGKNLVGAFHQPAAVIIDSETLNTLPLREYRAGLAEVVKYGVIRDPGFFEWLELRVDALNEREVHVVLETIARCVRNKADVVAEDEKEHGVRALLNFGHTFAHALETLSGYNRYLHGEAVAIGMVVATTLSEQRGLCAPGCATRIAGLLDALGLSLDWPAEISAEAAWEAMAMDKKALDSGLRLILAKGIGQAFVDQSSSQHDIVRAIETHTAATA